MATFNCFLRPNDINLTTQINAASRHCATASFSRPWWVFRLAKIRWVFWEVSGGIGRRAADRVCISGSWGRPPVACAHHTSKPRHCWRQLMTIRSFCSCCSETIVRRVVITHIAVHSRASTLNRLVLISPKNRFVQQRVRPQLLIYSWSKACVMDGQIRGPKYDTLT